MAEEQKNKTEHTLKKKGFLKGHGGWVTSLAVGEEEIDGEKVEFLLSGSRDKTLIKWRLDEDKNDEEDREWGRPAKMFTGHSHFVNEICLTIDGRFCFSASWDGTVRLWNTTTGKTVSKLIGHTRDVLSVALSADCRQILTGGRDHQIKIWNVKAECKHTVDKNAHTDAVSCVRFYHAQKPAICVTASWDKTIKVWDNTYMKLMHTFMGHKAQINSIDMVNNSSYLASGSHDGQIMVWDLIQGKWLTSHDYDSPVNCVLFSQKLYWVIVGTEEGIKVFDLPSSKNIQEIRETSMLKNDLKQMNQVVEVQTDNRNKQQAKDKEVKYISCTSLAWNKSDDKLYSGWSDHFIRVYQIEELSAAEQ
jgi:guanine nucleotide-binding protein subunit beta-2-like 1 protein